jgi:hypothetical protein
MECGDDSPLLFLLLLFSEEKRKRRRSTAALHTKPRHSPQEARGTSFAICYHEFNGHPTKRL